MKLKPNYIVSYRGVWHNAGIPFDISPADKAEMSQHGEIIEDEPAAEPKEQAAEPKKTTKKK